MQQYEAAEEEYGDEVDYDFDEQADDVPRGEDAGTGLSNTAPCFLIFRACCDLPEAEIGSMQRT